jgi:hypothetical protein
MGCSSGRVILVCEHCGERLVLGEPEEVWLSTRTRFECECGRDVSLASRLEEPTRAENYETQQIKPASGRYKALPRSAGRA